MTESVTGVHLDLRPFEKLYKRFPGETKKIVGDALDHAGRSFFKRFNQERLKGPPGVRTQSMARGGMVSRLQRATRIPQGSVMDMALEFIWRSEVAWTHEKGRTLTPSKGKFLLVPFQKFMFSSAGFLKKQYKQLAKKRTRHKVVIKLKGEPYLVFFRNKKHTLEYGKTPLFKLERSVRIPPRLGFFATWDRQRQRNIEIVATALRKVTSRLQNG